MNHSPNITDIDQMDQARECNIVATRSRIIEPQVNRQANRELRVLLQAIIVSALVILTVFLFFTIPNQPELKWPRFITTLTWLTCSGLNPLIYISFNSKLRRKIIQVMKCNHQNRIGTFSAAGGRAING
uniref:G-protein coupled receptors family 1 profile domain-containing protein n=1 Tax=Romanomermis culicivorax TaxID=13658 RepID=A0A915J556_ROMCU